MSEVVELSALNVRWSLKAMIALIGYSRGSMSHTMCRRVNGRLLLLVLLVVEAVWSNSVSVVVISEREAGSCGAVRMETAQGM